MPKTYFRQIPDLDYVNRTDDGKGISNYTEVKNLFKRGRLRADIFQDTTFFEKYQIKGDDRPDNVAFGFYGSENFEDNNNMGNLSKLRLTILCFLFPAFVYCHHGVDSTGRYHMNGGDHNGYQYV